MGKKKDKKKKGAGAEKTAAKTEKKAARRSKKDLATKGEEDIEALIAQFQEEDRKKVEVIEEKCPPPSPRKHMSLTAHPDKEELVMFGGEFFTGKKTFMYNELYVYLIRKNSWLRVTSPNPPPPRCAHQCVGVSREGGQLWLFGGEFASPTQSQFYHYKDLWCLSLNSYTWTRVKAHGGPSARSGHRMIALKRQLFVFCGFHDNLREFRYFNDVHVFDLDVYQWTEVQLSGTAPAPRSACQMGVVAPSVGQGLLVYGGYRKEKTKRDAEQGVTCTDMYLLQLDKHQPESGVKLRWQALKQSGELPTPRAGFSWVQTSPDRLLMFGGVQDEHEDDEEITSRLCSDLFTLDTSNYRWFPVTLRPQSDSSSETTRRRRRRRKNREAGDSEEESDDAEQAMDELTITDQSEAAPADDVTYDDGIFKVSVAEGSTSDMAADTPTAQLSDMAAAAALPAPCARYRTCLCVRGGVLYLYGGSVERNDTELCLADMWKLDLKKLDQWHCLREFSVDEAVWEESSSDEEMDNSDEESSSDEEEMETG